ncbi:hypothetical protein BJV78DRAFT_100670 [Lactifluus subvellereus]|nr:hypothetical protein BJV78DRAFT_100670 [Lactifluus subvellereus]
MSSTDRPREQAETPQKPISNPSSHPQTPPSASLPTPVSLAAFIGGRATGPRLNKHAPQQDAADPTLFEQRKIDSSTAPHPVFGRGGIAMPGLTSQGRKVDSPSPSHELYARMPATSTRGRSPGPAANHEHASPNAEPIPVSIGNNSPGKESPRPPRTTTPSAALKRYVQHIEQAASPQANKTTFERDVSRSRTLSTPTGTHPTRTTTFPLSPPPPLSPRTPNFGARSPPLAFAGEPSPSKSPNFPPASKPSTPAPTTPRKPAVASASSPAFSVKLPTFSASTPSLPRPEAFSAPKAAAPFTPQHRTPYLPPPKEKDPTPSISRLKGRGFVQSMVKASSALEAAAAGSATSEVGRLGPVKRSPPVADRWKPESSPSSSQLATTAPANFRKSWTPTAATPSGQQKNVAHRKSWAATSGPLKGEEPSDRERPPAPGGALEVQNTGRSVRLVETHHTGRSAHAVVAEQHHEPTAGQSSKAVVVVVEPQHLRKAPSLPPSLTTPSRPSTPPRASPGGHGLGSSSTMFSYIKPTKTGDDPATGPSHPLARTTTPHNTHSSAADLTSTEHADELGHRTGGVSSGGHRGRNGAAGGIPAPSGRPLVHLTKGRPKPKKARASSRKRAGGLLPETGGGGVRAAPTAPSATTRKPLPSPRSATAHEEATRIPVPMRIHQPSTHTPTTPSPSTSHIIKPDRPDPNISDRWSEQALSGSTSRKKPPLFGLAGPSSLILQVGLSLPSSPSQAQPSSSASPRSPRRQSRIPSTGARALVMDVAQALREAQAPRPGAETTSGESSVAPSQPELRASSPSPMEKKRRKSSFDAFVMERKLTTRSVSPEADVRSQEPPGQQDKIPAAYQDEPLPRVNLDEVLSAHVEEYHQPSSQVTSISVDVMSVTGATATGVKRDANVFYDSELLAIVHRCKTKSTGLVETTLWSWQGRRSQVGEREERKLKDMARHYGTRLCPVRQGCEPPELVHALGGQLATRQGTRSRWSAENTTMHQVRFMHGNVFIDEHDLHVTNLCSAFSYCLTLLGTSYVWHGKGSLPRERQAALGYAQSLSAEGTSPVELVERESDDNEMFWMLLGDADDYANADYWKWRPKSVIRLPRIWRVDALCPPHITAVPALSTQPDVHSSVYLVDCVWELFVLVGTKARGSRRDIRLALSAATDLSSQNAADRPFRPPIHVLLLPSKLPLDLRLHFRDLDEDHVNGTFSPDHMNLLELSEALSDVGKPLSLSAQILLIFPYAAREGNVGKGCTSTTSPCYLWELIPHGHNN